ncbi:calcium-binding protein [Shinella pollutisoli]|uniref:Calcium-binding protein n=1 Tax=Shinella pollutisoli TaxID=2250594 RepID=A0ABV7DJU0_9HYPH|nr:calcium-binding protein [Shinella pollutisoli]
MGTITSNISRSLDGKTSFTIGNESYVWGSNGFIMSVETQAKTNAVQTAEFTLSGDSWTVAMLRFAFNTKAIIKDSTSGGTNRFVEFISLVNSGGSDIALNKTTVGIISGGSGADKITIGDVEVDTILSGGGKDTIKTGKGYISILDTERGNDTVDLGAGGAGYINLGRDSDRIILSPLTDKSDFVSINGGSGVSSKGDSNSDTVDFSRFKKGLSVDLATVDVVNTGNGTFLIRNFEHVSGGKGSDTLKGNGSANVLKGNAGNDTLDGKAGNDLLSGGTGNDRLLGGSGHDTLRGDSGSDKLYGGTGRDTLYGGSGKDTFVFNSTKDSTVAASGRDTIKDFSRKAGDKIDLKAIDADTHARGNQSFDFIGTKKFSKDAGELRYQKKSGDTYVYGDVNGDGKADFSILIDARTDFVKGDFIL